MSADAVDTLKRSDRLQVAELATRADLRDLEQHLTARLGGMLVVAVGVLLAAMKYLSPH